MVSLSLDLSYTTTWDSTLLAGELELVGLRACLGADGAKHVVVVSVDHISVSVGEGHGGAEAIAQVVVGVLPCTLAMRSRPKTWYVVWPATSRTRSPHLARLSTLPPAVLRLSFPGLSPAGYRLGSPT